MIKTTVTGADDVKAELRRMIKEFETEAFLTVGIHEDDAGRDSDEMTNAQLGMIHEYGADINHPGGTPYGYSTEADAEAGRLRFLKQGEGFMVVGVTDAHQIKVPARPWLVPGVDAGIDDYMQAIRDALDSGADLRDVLYIIGPVAVSSVQQYMTNLRTPPNAKSTIERKGSSNPLIDSGELKGSVAFKVQDTKPEEGL